MSIVTLGELLIDMFPAEDGVQLASVSAFRPTPGGAPANVAVAVKRLGVPSAFIGKVGDDAFGHHLASVLKNEGVTTQGLAFDKTARTTMAFIAKPDVHQAEFMFYRNPGADTLLSPDDIYADLIRSSRILHIGSLSLTHEPARSATHYAIDIARENNLLVSFDVNFRPPLWESEAAALEAIHRVIPKANLLKVNEDELRLLIGKSVTAFDEATLAPLASELLAAGPSAVIVTLGAAGSFFHTRDTHGVIPSFPVNTVDAVGSGDSFIAGVLTKIHQVGAWPTTLEADVMRTALRYGNAAGALAATKLGVIPALPTTAEVDAFLNQLP